MEGSNYEFSIVVPRFNEERFFLQRPSLTVLMNQLTADGLISNESTVTFVDDGSKDRT
jgi:glycosyltransferase involved in cell wall biosynthesis